MRRAAWLCLVLMLHAFGPAGAAMAAQGERRCFAALICIETIVVSETLELWLESLTDQALTVAVELVTLDGETQRHRTKATVGSPARQRLFALPAAGAGRPLFRWSLSFHPGHHPRRHDEGVVYRLPYAPGARFEVLQGPGGGFTHHGRDRHAIDWAMPEGATVHAARAGRVIGAYDRAPPGGTAAEDLGRDNFLWIEHDDGTVGWYAHLRHGSILVEPDERVAAGTPLARAGESGFASAPHLHFHVSTPSPGAEAYETLPIVFRLGPGRVGVPREGEAYRAGGDD